MLYYKKYKTYPFGLDNFILDLNRKYKTGPQTDFEKSLYNKRSPVKQGGI